MTGSIIGENNISLNTLKVNALFSGMFRATVNFSTEK